MSSIGASEAWYVAILPHAEHMARAASRLTSCGRALPLVSMKLVDLDGEEMPDGTVGELMVRSPMVYSAYCHRPAVTAEVLQEGWYCGGDMPRRDAYGLYYLVDRAKDMIIFGGENVDSIEVEQALLKHPATTMAAVIGLPDERWGEKVIALVVPHEGAAVTEDESWKHAGCISRDSRCQKYLFRICITREAGWKNSETGFAASIPGR